MNTEITDTVNSPNRDWFCYDAECAFCVRWTERFRAPLERHGFVLLPLQSAAVRAALAVPEDELLAEMRVVTNEGRVFGGADAFVYLGDIICKPLFGFTRIPGVRPLLRRAYRVMASNRACAAVSARWKRPGETTVAIEIVRWGEPCRLAAAADSGFGRGSRRQALSSVGIYVGPGFRTFPGVQMALPPDGTGERHKGWFRKKNWIPLRMDWNGCGRTLYNEDRIK